MTRERTISPGYGAIAVAVTALLVYVVALGNGFALDDVAIIPADPRVVGLRVGALLTGTYWHESALGLYRPLASLSYALDWSLSNGSAAWFHFTNILWHVAASVLAYELLRRLFRPTAALLAALLFAVHPVHTEAVANVVGRNELIAAVFFLAACIVWISDDVRPLPRALLTAVCYALAMFAKESAVMLPAILLLLDFARGERNVLTRARGIEYAPLAATFVAFMLIRYAIIGGIAPNRVDAALELATTPAQRVMTALQAWPTYARLLFFPKELLADYGPRIVMPATVWTALATLGLTVLLVTLIGGIVALWRGERLWALGLLWFPITILPVSNFLLPIGVVVAERTLYLPSLAACMAAAAALGHCHERARERSARRVSRAVAFGQDGARTAGCKHRVDALRLRTHALAVP
jgi:hypothetical protein